MRPITAAIVDTGAIAQARYRIDIPAGWNGGLIVVAHGYGQGNFRPYSALPRPLADVFLSRGFAVAASDFRTPTGWAIKEGIEDSEALRRAFVKRYGTPAESYFMGQSMGGHIAIATAERYGARYDGVLPMCGPLTPAIEFMHSHLFEMLVVFELWFPGALPQAPEGLADLAAPMTVDGTTMATTLGAAPERVQQYALRFRLKPADVGPVVAFYYSILKEMQKRAGGHPLDNRGTIYRGFGDDAAFNRNVRRYAASPSATAWLADNAHTSGRIQHPVLSVHTTYDQVVVPESINGYRTLTELVGTSANFQSVFVDASGHCNFTPAIVGKAFDMLRNWVKTGQRPVGGELR